MTKFFRKYGRVLVLVVMSLLLVIFLIQDVVMRGGSTGMDLNAEVGRAFGTVVTRADAMRAYRDLLVAGNSGLFADQDGRNWFRVPGQNEMEAGINAHLLKQEAHRMGVRVSADQVEAMLRADDQRAQAFDQLRAGSGRSQADMLAGMAEILAAYQLAKMQLTAAETESVPRYERQYQQSSQNADVLVAAIDAHAFLPRIADADITADDLNQLFDAGKERKQQHKDDEPVFGYVNPDRVEIEYLTIDPAPLVESISVIDRDAKAHFERNKAKYTRPAGGPLADPAQAATIQLTFDEAKEQVKQEVRQIKAAETAQRILNQMQQEAHRPWQQMPIDDKGARQPPPTAQIVSFEALRDKYAKQAAIVYKKTGLLDSAALRKEPGLGTARFSYGNRGIDVATLALHVTGLPEQPALQGFPQLHVGEPAPLVNQMAGDRVQQSFLFRVTNAVKSGPPASLDEVREKLLDDARLMKAYELAREAAEKLAERARQVGLEAAVNEAEALKATLTEAEAWAASQPAEKIADKKFAEKLTPVAPDNFSRRSGFAKNVNATQTLRERVFALATQPATDAAAAHKIAVIPVAPQFRWTVVEFKGVKPLYSDDFRNSLTQMKDSAMQMVALRMQYPQLRGMGGEDTPIDTFLEEWLTQDSLRQRAGWTATVAAN